MARNQKLTGVIQGRTVKGVRQEGGVLTIAFDDGSIMTVKTAGEGSLDSSGGKVADVRQKDTTLNLDFEDGSTLEVQTAEPTSSVMVRDKNGALEYVD